MQDRYLIDKPALARWTKPSVKEVLKPLHERCLLAVCQPTGFEMIRSPWDSSEATRTSTWLHAFDYLRTDGDTFTRGLEIQRHALDADFHHSSVPPRPADRRHRELNGERSSTTPETSA